MQHPPYDPELFPHWATLPIRYRDLDTLNHVNNAIFSTFYEEARIRFVNNVPELLEHLDKGYSFVLANIKIDFVRPVEYPTSLRIGTGLLKTGNTSLTCFQAIYHNGSKSLISVCKASGVWFNLDTKRPGRLPKISDIDKYIVEPGE